MEIKVEQKAVEQTIYVIGHINPDTDSICSAIAYAELKNKLGKGRYKARRAGQINAETQFVLKKFGIKQPGYLSDVRTQVKDLEYRIVEGMSRDMSIKKAWELMSEKMVSTMPILKPDGVLEGLITIPDIAKTYMDIYDREILSKSNTTIANIVETLTGELICGDMSDKLLDHYSLHWKQRLSMCWTRTFFRFRSIGIQAWRLARIPVPHQARCDQPRSCPCHHPKEDRLPFRAP